MGIELLVSKSKRILGLLPTDEKTSEEVSTNYKIQIEKLREKYKYFSPTYHKIKPEQIYLC